MADAAAAREGAGSSARAAAAETATAATATTAPTAAEATEAAPPARRRRRYVGKGAGAAVRAKRAAARAAAAAAAAGEGGAAGTSTAVIAANSSPPSSSSSSAGPTTQKGRGAGGRRVFRGVALPADIAQNTELAEAVAVLPWNYNFEVQKTLYRIRQVKATRVALQMPEGLLAYACVLADILERFGKVETVIMGDVTYGACCVDDFTSTALGCDLLVHYGHSCLVPVDQCKANLLYVFVDIKFDLEHFLETLSHNFESTARLSIVSTVQFAASLHASREALLARFPHASVPQEKPLSRGEVLGCTSPRLEVEAALSTREPPVGEAASATAGTQETAADVAAAGAAFVSSASSASAASSSSSSGNAAPEALVYLGDGRFHLESIMISNPELAAYRYDPYSKAFTRERYETESMHEVRRAAVEAARGCRTLGIVLGTLGRQGSTDILERLRHHARAAGKRVVVVLLSEIFPQKLASIPEVDCFVQIACPRLSIDWGYAFTQPLLNPYEAFVALGATHWRTDVYPMDFYSADGGEWSVAGARRAVKEAAEAEDLRNTSSDRDPVAPEGGV